MKIIHKRENYLKSSICIAKSVDLRPSILYIDTFDDNNATVKPVQEWYDKPLNVPRSILFHANKSLFKKLWIAYEKKDSEVLKRLWRQCRPWNPEER